MCGNAKTRPGRVRGPGRHGGGVVRPFDKLRAHQPRLPCAVGPWCRPWPFCPFLSRGKDENKWRSHRCPRHRTCQRWHDRAAGISIKREKQPILLAGLWKSCNFAGSWSRTRNEKPVDYQDVRGGRKDVPSSDNRLTPLFWGVFFFSFMRLLNAKLTIVF